MSKITNFSHFGGLQTSLENMGNPSTDALLHVYFVQRKIAVIYSPKHLLKNINFQLFPAILRNLRTSLGNMEKSSKFQQMF